LLPNKDAVYETNSLVALDGFVFEMKAMESLKEFKFIEFANSSFTVTTTLETTPAVNVESNVAEENMGDGMFELEALIVFVALRSVLGPYIDDEETWTKVALPASFQKILTELPPAEVNPISIGTAFPKDTFKKIAVKFEETNCPDIVMETDVNTIDATIEKKWYPVEVINRYPDQGLDDIAKGALDAMIGAMDTFTL
jgi:hypothetical protein